MMTTTTCITAIFWMQRIVQLIVLVISFSTTIDAVNLKEETSVYPHERIILTPHVYPFHASSAIEGFLRSSEKLTTLCSMRVNNEEVWNCEPGQVYVNNRTLEILGTVYQKPPIIKTREDVRGNLIKPLTRQLEFYGQYWDLSKEFLFCKFCQFNSIETTKEIQNVHLPTSFQKFEIKSLQIVMLIMWRPLCLHQLSSHSDARSNHNEYNQTKARAYLLEEIRLLGDAVNMVKDCRKENVKYMVVGQDLLMWQTEVLVHRMLAFLPGLLSLKANPDYSDLKSHVIKNSPKSCCDFDTQSRTCALTSDEYKLLNQSELASAQSLANELLKAEKHIVSVNTWGSFPKY